MSKFMMAINEEDGTIDHMSKSLGITKGESVILALNLLNYVLEQRNIGKHLAFTREADQTVDILHEATAGSVSFRLLH